MASRLFQAIAEFCDSGAGMFVAPTQQEVLALVHNASGIDCTVEEFNTALRLGGREPQQRQNMGTREVYYILKFHGHVVTRAPVA